MLVMNFELLQLRIVIACLVKLMQFHADISSPQVNRHYNNGDIQAARRASNQALKNSARAYLAGFIFVAVAAIFLMAFAVFFLCLFIDWQKWH